MAGTLPERRRRRLAPLPCAPRASAPKLNEIRMMFSNVDKHVPALATKTDTPEKISIYIQRADRLLVADPADRLGEQRRDRELADAAAAARGGRQRNGVGHDQLIEHRARDPLHRLTREHGVSDVGDHLGGTLILQRLCGMTERAGGIDHV